MKTVVITGFGALTPVGNTAPDTWAALLAGTSGISPITDDWATELPVRFAGQVDFDLETALGKPVARRMDRCTQLAVLAFQEAWEDAGLAGDDDSPAYDPDRTAVVLGTGVGGIGTTTSQWQTLQDKGVRRVSPFTVPMLMANAPAANIGLRVGAKASVQTAVSACASSNEAIALAADQLRLGRADVAITGGAEACVNPLPLAAFAQMQALSTRNDSPAEASRPWDTDRDGFVLGEGAVILVLETLEHAQARGARIYGTLAGAGMSADSFDIVQPDPSGQGQKSAMLKALADAGLNGADIVHVNAHATSTPAGDMTEATAIRSALGEGANPVVTGTKSQTGHLLGAAGALETFATMMALNTHLVPPTINLDSPEPDLDLDVATTTRELPAGTIAALNNSFGFGGHNICLALTNEHQNR
jgi:3-oxoacyl-[acyl-carrier-protein] synthase II